MKLSIPNHAEHVNRRTAARDCTSARTRASASGTAPRHASDGYALALAALHRTRPVVHFPLRVVTRNVPAATPSLGNDPAIENRHPLTV